MAEQRVLGRPLLLGRGPLKDWLNGFAGRRRSTLALAVASAYASCAMLVFINSRSIWLDESVSIAVASQPVTGIAHILRHVDAVHGLYYLLLHFWLYLGHGAIVVRLLSAAFAILAALEIAALGALMFEAAVAPGVVAILATSVFFLYYADEARPAALSLLTCALTALRWWRVVRYERTRDMLLCGFFAVIAVYANLVALVFIAALALSLAFVRLERRSVLILGGTALAGCLGLIPLAAGIRADSLIQVSWIVRSTPRGVFEFVIGLLGAFGAGPGQVSRAAALLAAATVAALMLLGAVRGWRTRETRVSVLAAGTWFVVPLVLAICVDARIQPILIARYFPFELLPIALLAANGLVAMWQTFRPASALGIIGLLGCISLSTLCTLQREDWRSVARLLSSEAHAGDAIVLWAPITITPFEFAVRERALREPARVLYPRGPLLNEVDYPNPEPGFALAASQHYRRIWLIDSHDLGSPGASPLAGLAHAYPKAHRQTFPDIVVTLYSR